MMSTNLSNIAILNNKSADYCCIIIGISKSEVINLMQKVIWPKRANIKKGKNLLSHIKMGKVILMFGDIEIEKKNYSPWRSDVFKKM